MLSAYNIASCAFIPSSACRRPPSHPLTLFRLWRFIAADFFAARPFHHQVFPMTEYYVRHHIEDGGLQQGGMCHASLPMERFSIVPFCPCHHLEPLPVSAEETECPVPHAISIQDINVPEPVQSVVHLVRTMYISWRTSSLMAGNCCIYLLVWLVIIFHIFIVFYFISILIPTFWFNFCYSFYKK